MITYVHKLKQQINSFENIYQDEYGTKPRVYNIIILIIIIIIYRVMIDSQFKICIINIIH